MSFPLRFFINLTTWWEVDSETGEEVLIADNDSDALFAFQNKESYDHLEDLTWF